jgi:hypothetical protein
MLDGTDHSKLTELTIAFFNVHTLWLENVDQEQIDVLSGTKALAGGEITATV